MSEENPRYTYAIKRDDGAYGIIHNHRGILVFGSVEEAESHSKKLLHSRGPSFEGLEIAIIDLDPLVKEGIIPRGRLFGSESQFMKSLWWRN